MAARYDWVTIDETNAGMMRYASRSGSGPRTRIDLFGTFVDQGVAGEAFVEEFEQDPIGPTTHDMRAGGVVRAR